MKAQEIIPIYTIDELRQELSKLIGRTITRITRKQTQVAFNEACEEWKNEFWEEVQK